jgi:hypothetical protein
LFICLIILLPTQNKSFNRSNRLNGINRLIRLNSLSRLNHLTAETIILKNHFFSKDEYIELQPRYDKRLDIMADG